MRRYEDVGVAVAEVLLPKAGIDWTKWAVVACDQYTSEPEYWQQVESIVGDAPSTLHLIYPEVYLGEKGAQQRIERIRKRMDEYLAGGVLESHEGFVYVEREAAGKVRRGIVLAVDLEHYDFRKGSSSLIRATEGTILERIPPRVKIRAGAGLELPHIMILIDDPSDSVIGPLRDNLQRLTKLYDFDLMMESGHLRGFKVDDIALEQTVAGALGMLAHPGGFKAKYQFDEDLPVLLYAMGDGNHSLATAKTIWEELKGTGVSGVMDSPKRHALVELVNVHDEALVFEPIHRVVFDLAGGRDLLSEMESRFSGRLSTVPCASLEEMKKKVAESVSGRHRFGVVSAAGYVVVEISRPDTNLPVGTLQSFLDNFMKDGGAREIDYVHGTEPVDNLGRKAGNIGFYLPAMDKAELFKSVILDGALPRKTFSMGEAFEKRFYVECRQLR